MRYTRADIVDRAIALLESTGLEELSMRALARDLGVQPSALYHHFAGKADFLGSVADEVLARGRRPTEVVTWQAELQLVCVELRDTMLRHRDGAALVSTVQALGVGAAEPMRRMAAALQWAGADEELARVGARTLLHFVVGHVGDVQAQRVSRAEDDGGEGVVLPGEEDFAVGMSVILDGLAARMSA